MTDNDGEKIASDDSAAPARDEAPAHSPATLVWVLLIIVAAGLVFLGGVGILYKSWITESPPTVLLELERGNSALAGCTFTVSGHELRQPIVVVLDQKHDYGERIYLQEGLYDLRLNCGDEVLFSWQGVAMRPPGGVIPLHQYHPTTRPATQPAE